MLTTVSDVRAVNNAVVETAVKEVRAADPDGKLSVDVVTLLVITKLQNQKLFEFVRGIVTRS